MNTGTYSEAIMVSITTRISGRINIPSAKDRDIESDHWLSQKISKF